MKLFEVYEIPPFDEYLVCFGLNISSCNALNFASFSTASLLTLLAISTALLSKIGLKGIDCFLLALT